MPVNAVNQNLVPIFVAPVISLPNQYPPSPIKKFAQSPQLQPAIPRLAPLARDANARYRLRVDTFRPRINCQSLFRHLSIL